MSRVLDRVSLNLRRIIAREWLIFVACLLVSLMLAGAIAHHAGAVAADAAQRAAAAADTSDPLGAWLASGSPPPPTLFDRASQLAFHKVSAALLLILYLIVSLVRSVFWAVMALRQPAIHGVQGEVPAAME